jgi:DNA replication protein DnaC
MSELKLYGMKTAYDEIMATGIKRQHEPPGIVGDLLQAEVSEKQARSIKYQIATAKLPLAKDLDDFQFAGTPINGRLARDLAQGDFLAQRRNCVLAGGTGAGKTHLAIAIARNCIRAGKRAPDTVIACREYRGAVRVTDFWERMTPKPRYKFLNQMMS